MSGAARRGVVLVTVLWTIALLASLAMATSLTFRGFAGIMAVDHDRMKADGLLTAGLEVAAGLASRAGERPLLDVKSAVTLSSGTVRFVSTTKAAASTSERRRPKCWPLCCAQSERPTPMRSRVGSWNGASLMPIPARA